MSKSRILLVFLSAAVTVLVTSPWASRASAAKLTLEFIAPSIATPKPTAPAWTALSVMFNRPVKDAMFAIDGDCPTFMPVPGFTDGADTVTIRPPGGYRIPVGKHVFLMVMSDHDDVMMKPNPAAPARPVNVWKWKTGGSEELDKDKPAFAIPEPATVMLVVAALPMLLAGRRRLRQV